MRYIVPIRAMGKLNGLQAGPDKTLRQQFNERRSAFQAHLYDHYPQPRVITGDCVLYYCCFFKDAQRPDDSNCRCFIEDCIQVSSKRRQDYCNPFALIRDDRQIVGASWFSEYAGRCVQTGCAVEEIHFEVVRVGDE